MTGLWFFFCAHIYLSEHLLNLRSRYSSYDQLWEKLLQNEWVTNSRYTKSWERICRVKSEQENYQHLFHQYQKQGITLIDIEDVLYPPLLKEIYHAPLMLCLKGDGNILKDNFVSIVGTRKASDYGLSITDQIVKTLAACGFSFVSGLAYGIDSQVHISADAYKAQTIAVVPASLLNGNWGGNNRLRQTLSSQHLFLSENVRPDDLQKFHFVQRNRLIAGLSKWTIVIEAPEKSGALITAGFARDENREVLAIPHALHHVQGKGCLRLIRDGAQIITDIDELPILLGLPPPSPLLKTAYDYDSAIEKLVHEKIQARTSLDDIAEELSISSSELLIVLTDLTCKGYIKNNSVGY